MEKRKSGFYWVKTEMLNNGDWIAASWDENILWWDVPGYDDAFYDNYFKEINENRIMSPDEWE